MTAAKHYMPGSMSFTRAQEIAAACVAHCSWPCMTWGDGDAQPPLPDSSLEEMLVANRVVAEAPPKRVDNGDGTGSTKLLVCCDPRVIAACYALKHYGGSPANLLQALGYRFTSGEDRRTKRRKAAEQRAKRADDVRELILWRRESLGGVPTAHEVAESLSVESLRDGEVPERLEAAVTSFRHLRQDARVAACRRALAANGGAA